MKTLACLPVVVCTTAFQMLAATPETSKHFVKFTDPVSGAVSYLLKPGEYGWNQQSIYFTAKSMTDDGRFLLFHVAADERDKKVNHRKTLWAFDFERDDAFPLPSAIGGRRGTLYDS